MPDILTNKGCVKINNTEQAPQSLQYNIGSLLGPDSGVSDAGITHNTYIKRNLPVLEISMPPLTPTQLTSLLGAIQGNTYQMTYQDPYTGTEQTKYFTTDNTSGSCYSGVLYKNYYTGVSFTARATGA